jgi:NAD+ kinase
MTQRDVRTIGLVPHPQRLRAHELAAQAAKWIADRGVAVRVPEPDAGPCGLEHLACPENEFATGLDIAVSLGGDGTMLRTVDIVYEAGVPVLGVNVGDLGYLTEVEPDPEVLEASLERLLAGDYDVEQRMMLQVEVETDGPASGRWWALNEAVLERVQNGRIARIDVLINKAPFTTYAADGVIVSTPTGSTAYSFSARGPIVSPRHRCLLLTPVSPHMLFDRSLVLDADEELRFVVVDERNAVLTLDGRLLGTLEPGDTVVCTAAERPARIVVFGPRNFHQILKTKFRLPDR